MTQYEGTNILLYSDPYNPYESIYIRAKVEQGKLTISDDECEHAPDGGWSFHSMEFDEENTQKFLLRLSMDGQDPFDVLKSMVGYQERTRTIKDKCQQWSIPYESYYGLSF